MAAYSHCRETNALSATISLQQLTDQLDALDREGVLVVPLKQDEVAKQVVCSCTSLDHTWID